MLNIGQKAPSFSLVDQDKVIRSLEDYLGSWVVVYFYPKDDTPGCTVEACGFRDEFEKLRKGNIVVLGISKDSVESHQKFREKYHLNHTLLSDEEMTVIKQYGAWGRKKFMGKEYDGVLRITYLIDPKGEVKKIYEHVKPETHAKEIIQDITSITV